MIADFGPVLGLRSMSYDPTRRFQLQASLSATTRHADGQVA